MTDGHLLPERLAEHAEGLLDTQDARAVEDHLRGCARCRETAAALESVSSRLAAAPRLVPTPPDVVERVDRALAAEWGERARQESSPPVGILDRLRARLPALAAATAGVAVLGFAGWAVGIGSVGGGDDSADGEIAADVPQEAQDEAGGGEAAEPEGAPRDDAATQGDGGDGAADEDAAELRREDSEAAEDAPAAGPDTLRGDEQALEEQVLDVAHRADPGGAGDRCGARLADEQGAEVVGSAPTDLAGPGAVLVVLDSGEPGTVRGWVLPSCDAGPGDALTSPLTVSVE
ncbi:MAG: zf-HC2 domain-containing protein [Actinomycetota bacterium]